MQFVNYSQSPVWYYQDWSKTEGNPKVYNRAAIHLPSLIDCIFRLLGKFLNIHSKLKKTMKTSLVNCFTKEKLFQIEEKHKLKR